jgi:hypothetical protein
MVKIYIKYYKKMKNWIDRLLDFSLVRWVINKNKKTKEKGYYLLVTTQDKNYLFTSAEVKKAEERAKKNPEDNFEEADFV